MAVRGEGGTPASGVIVGAPVDFVNADVFTNLFVAAGASLSGGFRVLCQTSDSTASGTFTDPTSGLADMPTKFLSGGVMVVGSGTASGMNVASGLFDSAGFLSPHRYGRVLVLSGDLHNAPVFAGFVKQLRTWGSGAGFDQSPTSGTVSV